jgi:hypothetical protein
MALIVLALAGLPALQAVAAPHDLVSTTQHAHGLAAENWGPHDFSHPGHAELHRADSREHRVAFHSHAGHCHDMAAVQADGSTQPTKPCQHNHCKNCVACCCAVPSMAVRLDTEIELLIPAKMISRPIVHNEGLEGFQPSPMHRPPRSI